MPGIDENKFIYISSNGEKVSFNGKTIFGETALKIKGNAWGYSFENSSIQYIRREGREEDLDVKFINISDAKRAINIFDYDCSKLKPGTLKIDDWQQQVYIINCELSDQFNEYVSATMKVILLNGYWIREKIYHLEDFPIIPSDDLDYPHDYMHDYAPRQAQGQMINIESTTGAQVGIVFYGQCNNPYLTITNLDFLNTYMVNSSCGASDKIVINPYGRYEKGESVYKLDFFGKKTNLFSEREKGSEGSGTYIFEKLPEGKYFVSWRKDKKVDLYIFEEMGTPPWI